MSRVCDICGKRRQVGNNVSHAKNRTKKYFLPNLHKIRIKEEGNIQRIKICTRCLRTGNFTPIR